MALQPQSQPFPLDWTSLGSDLTELILSHLPIRALIRASAVCKLWKTIISSKSFTSRISTTKKPWFFLLGQNNIFLKNNQAFAFDPESNEWIRLPSTFFPPSHHHDEFSSSFIGSSGFFFVTSSSVSSKLSYAPILKHAWNDTPPLKYSRFNPLVGVFSDLSGFPSFIVVGGVRFIGGLVDIEDRLAVEIYNPKFHKWELCSPLPADFRPGNSSQSLSSAVFKEKFYVFGISSFFVSSFDMKKHVWSEVQTLRPPGVISAFLISCENQLILAGLCNSPRGPSFTLWKVEEESMEFSERAIMPQDLLYGLFDTDEDDKFASLKCVGLGNLIYVFNEQYHRNYPASVCDISSKTGTCRWRRVPHLPSPVNQFHKVISFCTMIPLGKLLQSQAE